MARSPKKNHTTLFLGIFLIIGVIGGSFISDKYSPLVLIKSLLGKKN